MTDRRLELAGWVFVVLLGPINFAGEIVGPGGHVAWRMLFAGFLGTVLWIGAGLAVMSL